MVKEMGKGKCLLPFFYNFWALALFGFELCFWKSFIATSNCIGTFSNIKVIGWTLNQFHHNFFSYKNYFITVIKKLNLLQDGRYLFDNTKFRHVTTYLKFSLGTYI